jgi:hypothetical protein
VVGCLPSKREALSATKTKQKKKRDGAVCQWLTPAILATQESEIRRIEVRRQPRQTDPISKNPLQKRADGVAQGESLEFKHQYHKKKKKVRWMGWGTSTDMEMSQQTPYRLFYAN